MNEERPITGKVLVTGASGHVGANVVRRLLADGVEVRALVEPGANDRALAGLSIEHVSGDIRDPEAVDRAVRGVSRVFHVAAKISTINALHQELRDLYAINVLGTRYVMQAALRHGVTRVVLTGSFSAVGYDPDDPTQPSTPELPFYPFDAATMPYARTKALAEHELLKAVVDGLDAVIATSCACIGPWDYLPSRIGKTLCDYADGRFRAFIPGGFPFVRAEDLADGHVRAMTRGRRGQKYIFATAFHTMDEMVAMFAEATGLRRRMLRLPPRLLSAVTNVYAGAIGKRFPKIPQRLTPSAIRVLELGRRADTTRAQEELGWRPTNMQDAIRDAYEFFAREGMTRGAARASAPAPA